jgi:hypothetical protein
MWCGRSVVTFGFREPPWPAVSVFEAPDIDALSELRVGRRRPLEQRPTIEISKWHSSPAKVNPKSDTSAWQNAYGN